MYGYRRTRRKFLSELSVSAAALPFLAGLQSLSAKAANGPKRRLIVIYSPNGTVPPAFFPVDGPLTAPLPQILSPFESIKNRILVVQGLDNLVAGNGASAHAIAVAALLTGAEMIPGADGNPEGLARGISIDQVVANSFAVSSPTRFKSLEFGEISHMDLNVRNRISYAGPGNPLPPEDDPARMFQRLFGGISLANRRISVLDYVNSELRSVRASLSGADARLLDAHTDAVRELEQSVTSSLSTTATCNSAALPAVDTGAAVNRPMVIRQHIDLMVRAFACDQTRVMTLQFENGTSDGWFPWLGFNDLHHELSHADDTDLAAQGKLVAINRWFATEVAYLATSLAAVPESDGNGTLLDNTTIVWFNDFNQGNTHSRHNLPTVVLGSPAYFKLGQAKTLPSVFHNRMLISLAASVGVDIPSIGEAQFCTGGAIGELTV